MNQKQLNDLTRVNFREILINCNPKTYEDFLDYMRKYTIEGTPKKSKKDTSIMLLIKQSIFNNSDEDDIDKITKEYYKKVIMPEFQQYKTEQAAHTYFEDLKKKGEVGYVANTYWINPNLFKKGYQFLVKKDKKQIAVAVIPNGTKKPKLLNETAILKGKVQEEWLFTSRDFRVKGSEPTFELLRTNDVEMLKSKESENRVEENKDSNDPSLEDYKF